MPLTTLPGVSLHNVQYGYVEAGRSHTLFQDLNLNVAPGEFVALVGRSGSGKTSLLNLLGGLDVPTRGMVRIGETVLSNLGEPDRTLFRREQIGFVYQFFNLLPTLTVRENILLPVELNGLPTDSSALAFEMLYELGLEDRLNSYPDRLSGGEQQRVAIVRALAHNPKLILADEPTGNLDDRTGEAVLDLLDRTVRAKRKTLIMVTHSQEVARRADRVLHLHDGRFTEST